MSRHLWLVIFGLCFVFNILGCNNSDISKDLRISHAERILGGDSAKIWIRSARFENGSRITLGTCDDEEELIFLVHNDSNILYKIGESVDCESTISVPDTLINGTFEVLGNIDNFITDTIVVTDPAQNLDPWVIRRISSKFLEFLYQESVNGEVTEVVEQYIF